MAKFVAYNMLLALKEEEYKITEYGKSTCLDVIDRFTVDIPYSDGFIKTRVLFNAMDPSCPPDFIIMTPQTDIEVPYSTVISDWNISDRRGLLSASAKIKDAFSEYNERLFKEYKNQGTEMIYNIANKIEGLTQRNEIRVNIEGGVLQEIVISVPFPITLAHESCTLPIYCHVSILPHEEKFTVNLQYPQWATHLHHLTIGALVKAQNPYWQYSSFYSLINQLVNFLKKETQSAGNSKDLRALFMQCLCNSNLGIPLEIDSIDFLKICFHMEIPYKTTGSTEIVQLIFQLPTDFPKSPPSYKLRSQKIMRHNELREKKYGNKFKGWSSDLEISQLVVLVKQRLNDDLKDFLSWVYST